MIRVTERSRICTMTLAQSRAASRLDVATRIASSGQRVDKPSDDPTLYASKVRGEHALVVLEERANVAGRALGELEVAHDALSSAVDLLARARELAISGSNGTLAGDERRFLAEEARALRGQMLTFANTSYDGKYLFGGTRTDAAPFDPTTGAFFGTDTILHVPVLEGVTTSANVSGARAFTAAGGRDVFADLGALADALDANDPGAVSATLGSLDAAQEQLIRSQVEAGLGVQRLRGALDAITSTKASTATQLSREIAGDPVAHLSDLMVAQSAYERSVAVTKQLLSIATSAG